MPSRAYASLLPVSILNFTQVEECVNTLSGLCLIVTGVDFKFYTGGGMCQYPLGLMPHCYKVELLLEDGSTAGVNALSGLCLIVTFLWRFMRY